MLLTACVIVSVCVCVSHSHLVVHQVQDCLVRDPLQRQADQPIRESLHQLDNRAPTWIQLHRKRDGSERATGTSGPASCVLFYLCDQYDKVFEDLKLLPFQGIMGGQLDPQQVVEGGLQVGCVHRGPAEKPFD